MRVGRAIAVFAALFAVGCEAGLDLRGDGEVVVGQTVTLDFERGPAPGDAFALRDAGGVEYTAESPEISFERVGPRTLAFQVPAGITTGSMSVEIGGDYSFSLRVLRLLALQPGEGDGLVLYDLARPSASLGRLGGSEGASSLALSADGAWLVYTKRALRELHYVDLTEDPPGPGAPALELEAEPTDLALAGNLAVIGDGAGVTVVERTASRAQVLRGRLLLGRVSEVAATGTAAAALSTLDRDGDGDPDQRLLTWIDMSGAGAEIVATHALPTPTNVEAGPARLALTAQGDALVVDPATGQLYGSPAQDPTADLTTTTLPPDISQPTDLIPAADPGNVHIVDAASSRLFTATVLPTPVFLPTIIDLPFAATAISRDGRGRLLVAGAESLAVVDTTTDPPTIETQPLGEASAPLGLVVQP